MGPAVEFNAFSAQSFGHDPGIFFIESQHFAAFLLPLLTEHSFGTALDDIWHTVEFGSLTAQPHFIQFQLFTAFSFTYQSMRHYSITAAGTGKTGSFRQGA